MRTMLTEIQATFRRERAPIEQLRLGTFSTKWDRFEEAILKQIAWSNQGA